MILKTWIERNLKGDPAIWIIVILLSIFSVLVVYSATGTLAYKYNQGNTEHYLIRHGLLLVLSLFAMWVAHKIDYRYYSRLSLVALWVSVPLLIFSWKFGTNINEASRWITLPFINKTFQPSDLAQLALITHLAAMLAKRQQNIDDVKESLIPILLWVGTIVGLIAMTNISTAALIFTTCLVIMFIGRVPVKYLSLLVLVGIMAGLIAVSYGERGGTAYSRIEDFLDPQEVPFQAQQSYIAIAKGGLTGEGPGRSTQRNFLPHPYSDFIYAIIIEEYGMFGGLFVILLYLALLYRGMKATAKSERPFGGLLAAGLSVAIVLQAMINISVTVGLFPITGLPLPMISMGGTSLLVTGISLGIILSVSRGQVEQLSSSKNNDFKNVARAA